MLDGVTHHSSELDLSIMKLTPCATLQPPKIAGNILVFRLYCYNCHTVSIIPLFVFLSAS